jgi:hypothetical protein
MAGGALSAPTWQPCLARVAAESDRYLFDIIKHGGSPIGRPGMPAFGVHSRTTTSPSW